MRDPQPAILPPCLRQPGLFAALGFVAQEDLAGDGEDAVIGEAVEQRLQKIRLHPHVAVQQHHDVVLRGTEARVRAAAEAQILFERKQLHLRIILCAATAALPSVEPLSTIDNFAAGMVRHGASQEGRKRSADPCRSSWE